jgi:hypothetical protein
MVFIPIIDEPLRDRVHRLASPAYPVSPPSRHGRKARGPQPLQRLWHAGVIPVRAVDFYRLRNVFVGAGGIAFDDQGRLYRACLGQSTETSIAAAVLALNTARQSGIRTGFSGPAVLCAQPTLYPYRHWLTVGLPSAALARSELRLPGMRYVVADAAEPLRAAMRESLGLLGIADTDIIEIGQAARFFEELIVIDGLAQPDLYLSPLVADCLDGLAAGIPPGQAEFLYVSPAQAEPHRLAHEQALIRIAEREGYEVVMPDQMRLIQRIGLFKGARRIVGLAGGAMANALFMPPEGHVGTLMPAGVLDNSLWLISQIRHHRYAELPDSNRPSAADTAKSARNQAADVLISETQFRRFLRVV